MQSTLEKLRRLDRYDALIAAVVAGFSIIIGPSIKAVVGNNMNCPGTETLLDSFCSEDRDVFSGLCPVGYQSFYTTCVLAYGNGTQQIFSDLVVFSDFNSDNGRPMMTTATENLIDGICTYFKPTSASTPVCVSAQVLTCSAMVWDSFVALFEQGVAHDACRRSASHAASQAGLAAGLMTAFLLSAIVVAVRACTKPESNVGSSSTSYSGAPAPTSGTAYTDL